MIHWKSWFNEYSRQRAAAKELNLARTLKHTDGSYIKAIQLDAFKAGMSKAAEIALDTPTPDHNTAYHLGCSDSAKFIQAERDNTTEI